MKPPSGSGKTNPIQSQYKANQSQFPQRDTQYAIRDTKYKPNQTQFQTAHIHHWPDWMKDFKNYRFCIGGLLCKGLFVNHLGVYSSGYLHKPRHRVIEETLVAFAEIAFPAKVVFVEGGPVFHTPAATDGKMPAEQAFVTEILFEPGKGAFFLAGGQLLNRRFKDVA